MKKLRPSARVTVRPFAFAVPFFARKPVITTSSPAGKSVFLSPRFKSALGAPASIAQLTTLPSGSLTSTYSHPCGFTQSNRVSVPFNVTGWCSSNSAANEWCAINDAAPRSGPTTRSVAHSLTFIGGPPVFDHGLGGIGPESTSRSTHCQSNGRSQWAGGAGGAGRAGAPEASLLCPRRAVSSAVLCDHGADVRGSLRDAQQTT